MLIPDFPNKYSTAFSPKKDHPISVAIAKATIDIPSICAPKGIAAKAAVVYSAKEYPLTDSGFLIRLVTITSPVIAHITTVSQKVALIETRACLEGCEVFALAAVIAAEPNPASLVNRPLAIP